jgi:site-specific recombinase XerD
VVRVHDLRDANATLALMAGIDVNVVSAMLDHSTTRITQDLYMQACQNSRATWRIASGRF